MGSPGFASPAVILDRARYTGDEVEGVGCKVSSVTLERDREGAYEQLYRKHLLRPADEVTHYSSDI